MKLTFNKQQEKDMKNNKDTTVATDTTVASDTAVEIAQWFQLAKPTPDTKDLCTQTGCLLEEVGELMEAILGDHAVSKAITEIGKEFKKGNREALLRLERLSEEQRIAIVDACCDINVTSIGVLQYLGGVDILGAMKEVITSNNSKIVDGRFEYDANGKIQKPKSFIEPKLEQFIK